MEIVGEDLAALDAALAFLDEWDVETVGGDLGGLRVASSEGLLSPSSELVDFSGSEDRLTSIPAETVAASEDRTGGAKHTNVKNELLAATVSSPSPTTKQQTSDWSDDARGVIDVCPVTVDTAPRHKKRRDGDSAGTADPRALALQAVNLRVKRRRQKEELLELRQKVQQLESRLGLMKAPTTATATTTASGDLQLTKPAIKHRSPLGVVWERLAARQLKERERAEEENQRLKEMLDEHVKLARSLDRILRKRATAQRLSPDGMVISGREHAGETPHEDLSRVNNLVIDLEGLYSDIEHISGRFGITEQLETPFRDTKLRKDGQNGVFLESMDSRVLPFDMRSTGATVWQFLADESGGQARIYYQNCTNMTEDIRTCTYGIEMQHKETRAAFWGTSAMRKYVENGRIVISWAGEFEPVNTVATVQKSSATVEGAAEAETLCEFVFRHKGWVDITPSKLDPSEAVVMQSYYRIEPELADPSAADDPDEKISALMDFVISTTDARLDASHQFLENILLRDHTRR